MGEPVRRAERLEHPVEGPHRPEIADVLVRDRAERNIAIPEQPGVAQDPARIEIQVRLRIGPDLTGAREDHRDVREGGDPEHQSVALKPCEQATHESGCPASTARVL